MRRLLPLAFVCSAVLVSACGDETPECKQVISSCTDPCDIECDAGETIGCVGPDYGDYDIGEDERCCICTSE